MANIVDYVRTCAESFEERPLGRVDSLVLSWLAYMRIPEEVPEACTDQGISIAALNAQTNPLALVAPLHDPRTSEELLKACAESPRFGAITVSHAADEWSREAEKQFSALALDLVGVGTYLAFRGTDDTLVGWKENLNMAFQDSVPAQAEAAAYLARVAQAVEGPLWLGGHSKGGNLAVFATMTCESAVRERIQRCFAHDAPGFSKQAKAAAGFAANAEAEQLIDRTVPEESIVGLLFESADTELSVVKSTNPGILQHAPFSWVVEGNDFATSRAVSYDTYRTNKRIGAWMGNMTVERREAFVEVLYKLAQSSGEVTLSGITSGLADGNLQFMLQRLDNLPDAERRLFLEGVDDLVATMLLGPAPTKAETPAEKADAAADKIDDATARFNDRAAKIDKLLGL